MCLMKTYETRGRTVVEPPPRRGTYTSHSPAGVMRLPRDWRRTSVESVDYRRSRPQAIEYYEEPRRSTTRVRSVSRRRVSDVELRPGRTSYVDPRGSGYVNEHVTRRSVSRVRR